MELVYYCSGGGSTTLGNGIQIEFEPLGTVIYPAWMHHDQRNAVVGENICLHVEWPSKAGGFPESTALYIPPPPRTGGAEKDPFVHREFLQLARIPADPSRRAELDLRVTALMARLLQFARDFQEPETPISADFYVERARRYILENHARIRSIKEVALHAGISDDYLRHLFSEAGYSSPIQLLNETRIARVKELLRCSQLSIKQIASVAGFQNERYLSTRFRQATGNSPGEFRRKAQQQFGISPPQGRP